MTYGDANKSFQLPPKYLFMLEHSNPGSIVGLKTVSDGSFQYCFMAIAACIRGFSACRSVIVVDGTHLKGKYKGIMFVAATKDANEQIFPLAFGIGDVESDASWIWFFRELRRTFGCPENLLFVSDQHLGIKKGVDCVYPGTPHGLCTYHLQGNLKKWGQHAIYVFNEAAKSYKRQDFEEHMKNLLSFAPHAHEKVVSIDPTRWARSKCHVHRYWFLTYNCAECVNGRLRWARKLSICTLLECVRSLIGQWFVEWRAIVAERIDELMEFASTKLGRSMELARLMIVETISSMKYKVTSSTKNYIVDLDSRKCTCFVFDLDLIPCSHAAAAISKKKQNSTSYVSVYYTTETLCEIYAREVMPIPDPEEWCVPPEIASRVVGTPPNPRQ